MTALVRSEVRRALSRRIVRVVALLSFAAVASTGVLCFTLSSSANGAAIDAKIHAARQADARSEAESVKCLYEASQGRGSPHACDAPVRHVVHDPRFYRQKIGNFVKGGAGIAALIAWVLGASLVGAEFTSRGMTTSLTFSPTRWRLFAAKAAAALAVTITWAAATLGLLWVAMLPALAAHGGPLTGQPTNASIAGAMLRGLGLVAATTTIGFTLATFGRSTAAALGLGFGYVIVLENIVGTALEGWRPWLLLGNVIAFLTGDPSGAGVSGRSVFGAGMFLLAVAAGLLVTSGTTFVRRDVA
ncbi:MAG TPA: ABC transporter permease subunit [Acidimicrobiales bacterium]|nr:ABC transporter permease subunit [Acidimicrobiales bacterium]